MKHALATLALSLAACGDVVTLTVTEPAGSVELVPGGTVDFSWTLTGGGAELVIDATPLGAGAGPRIFDQDVPEGDGTFPWVGVDLEATLLPPDVYQVELDALVDGFEEDFALRTITVHGIHFTDPAPGETATITGTSYDLKVTTVSSRPMELTFSLVGATEIVIDTRGIGGEFVPFDRTVVFDGTGVPAGVYTIVVDATDGDALDYRVEGGMIDWQP